MVSEMLEWDRTHDWVVHCFESDRAELTVLFDGARPALRELAALRRCLPEFRDLPPATARARAGADGRLALGELPGPEARRLSDDLRRAGLRAELRNTSAVTYLPLDRTTGAALIVEDDAEARRLAEQMIRAGVPVERVAE
jgi:phosphatidylserine/phosphatidylglycerophosphate/cardiolipin synthase-like enzyme